MESMRTTAMATLDTAPRNQKIRLIQQKTPKSTKIPTSAPPLRPAQTNSPFGFAASMCRSDLAFLGSIGLPVASPSDVVPTKPSLLSPSLACGSRRSIPIAVMRREIRSRLLIFCSSWSARELPACGWRGRQEDGEKTKKIKRGKLPHPSREDVRG